MGVDLLHGIAASCQFGFDGPYEVLTLTVQLVVRLTVERNFMEHHRQRFVESFHPRLFGSRTIQRSCAICQFREPSALRPYANREGDDRNHRHQRN